MNTNEEFINEESNATQCNRILDYMKKGFAITQMEALQMFGCRSLAARIWDLRHSCGIDITTEHVENEKGKYIAQYTLFPDPNKTAKETPERYCAYCGKKMERRYINGQPECLSTFKRRKYCNRECMQKAFVKTNGDRQLFGAAHHSARMIMYLINGKERVCELCGSNKHVDVHHKDRNPNNNDESNLMLVCRSCHNKIHNHKNMCKLCGKPVKGHGYCGMHYIRWKKFGDPLMCNGRQVDALFRARM